MKNIKIAMVFLIAINLILFYSCQKNNEAIYERNSFGTTKDSLGNCSPYTIEGTYTANIPLQDTNYIDIHVNVDSVGKYVISTDTLNGFFFIGTGTFGYKGDNRVRLYGHGKPISGGSSNFIVSYGTSSCTITIPVLGAVLPPATYIVDTTGGTCSGAITNGTYSTNIRMNNLNTVTLNVTVSTIGSYSLSTATVNGISFSGTGYFTSTGVQTLVLRGSGTPQTVGTYNYSVSSGTSCVFSVNTVQGPTAAVYSFGTSGSCTGFTANGTYTAGTALTSSNTVNCQVNVTTIGVYSISTNTVNGITFSTSGTFTSTGSQNITLTGTGTPTVAGTNNFTATGTGTSCGFSITTAAGSSGNGAAVFSLGGAGSTCTGFTANGNYAVGTVLTSSNTMTCSVNITTMGTYSISTGTVNGMSFSKTGTFTSTGSQVVTLSGTGTPNTAGTNNFTLTTGSSSCTASIVVSAPAPPATGTLGGSPNACTNFTVIGNYVQGTLLAYSNAVTFDVNVTTTGSYSISTNSVNGLLFSGTGTFTSTGLQQVTLTGSGTAIAAGNSVFTVTFGSSTCSFTVPISAPTSPCTGLVDNQCIITNHVTLNGVSFGLDLSGQYQISTQSGFIELTLLFPGDNPPSPGTYSIGTVSITCPDTNFATNGITWTATSGKVYVSNSGGSLIVEFCNVTFKGQSVFGGGASTATGQGRIVL